MIAIAVQTIISMILCFAIGFVTAWIVRGGREQRGFQAFFANWRSRYDQLERDCDNYMARVTALQKELNAANARIVAQQEFDPTEFSVEVVHVKDQASANPQPSEEIISR